MKRKIMYSIIYLLIVFLLVELYARLFVNSCDPLFDAKTKIIKRKKNTEGIYKTKYTNTGYFRINNEGWNSHREYFKYDANKKPPAYRIAIIGHSNVEGLRVPINKTLSKTFEEELIKNGFEAEVYTFGFRGMHLAQALHIGRYVIKEFHPDIIIIATLLDNFLYQNTDKKNFLSLDIKDDNQIREILPEKYHEESGSPFSFLYFSKAVKYADLKFGFGEKIRPVFTKFTHNSISKQNHNQLLRDTIYENNILLGIDYILKEFSDISRHTPILIIDFPKWIPSLDCTKIDTTNNINKHHSKIINIIKNYMFPIITLEKVFLEDYINNHINLGFPNDLHYNQHAHKVIGNSLSNYFVENKILKQ